MAYWISSGGRQAPQFPPQMGTPRLRALRASVLWYGLSRCRIYGHKSGGHAARTTKPNPCLSASGNLLCGLRPIGLRCGERPDAQWIFYFMEPRTALFGHWLPADCCTRVLSYASATDEFAMRTTSTRGHAHCTQDMSALIVTLTHDRTLRVWDGVTARLVHANTTHCHTVLCCAMSADSRLLLVGYADGRARVLLLDTGALALTLNGHTMAIYGCKFSLKGDIIITASGDHTARLWDSKTGVCLHVLRGHTHEVCSCALAPDGQLAGTASSDKSVRLWNSGTGELVHSLSCHCRVGCCAFSPCGRRIATGGDDWSLRIFNVATTEPELKLHGHDSYVSSCAFLANGKRIVSASGDATARLWDSMTGEIVLVLRGHHGRIYGCVVSPDGKRIATAGSDGTLRMWDVTTGKLIGAIAHGAKARVIACDFPAHL